MAPPLVLPNPENATLQELKIAGKVGTFETNVRCNAIQMLIVGISREQICGALQITERSLRSWIGLFNAYGVDGLVVNKRPGRPHIIGTERASELTELINNPRKADRDFWTAKAFHGHITATYAVECSYQTVVRFFHQQGYALKVPRPWPDRQDEELRQAFREKLRTLSEDEGVDLWFGDESGFEGDPRPRRRWDKKGAKTQSTKNGDHLRMNVLGMVCPRSGDFFALEATHVCADMFQAFLDEAVCTLTLERRRNILILDNATWHKKKSLNLHGFEMLYLPPYSPDLNPIERLWLLLKARWFNNIVCKDMTALIERLDKALNDLIGRPEEIQRTTSFGKLL
jgi:transposase